MVGGFVNDKLKRMRKWKWPISWKYHGSYVDETEENHAIPFK